MAWNEPGNGQKDPWNRNRQRGKPDLDSALKGLKDRFGKFGGGTGSILTALLAIVLAWLLLSSYTVIDARQVGVVLRFGEFSRMLTPGFHLKFPQPIESVSKVETTQVRSVSDKVRMLTSDENIITVDFNVQFQVSDARKFLFSARDPDGTLREAAEAAVRSVVGANVMDNILTSPGVEVPAKVAEATPAVAPETRETLQQQTREVLQATLDGYDAGLVVNDVSFQNVAPPQEVKDAFDDVNAAREDKQGTENQARAYASQVVPVARGDAARVAAEAEADRVERVARANGDTERFNLLLKEYHAAPDVTRRRLWLETVEAVMANNPKIVDGSGGRNVIYLPLDKVGGSKNVPGVGAVMQSATTTDANGQEVQP
ncbi:MAG TPA: FtsH protease activity modulator HflK [Luteibacter sp.]|jgi:modulator of FtsH protease HflK|nr:FtsH protease activity modulator HflK [Luteibacter sp.]